MLDDAQETISVSDLNEVFEMHLGQGWQKSLKDNRGCSMGSGSNRHWLSPQCVTRIVSDLLDALGVSIEPISIADMQREVLRHHYEEEYDPEEIAAIAKMSDDEVKIAYDNIND